MWYVGKKIVWYIGYITKIAESTASVNHLTRCDPPNNLLWMYPSVNDSDEVDYQQILTLKPSADWDTSNLRNIRLTLNNHEAIERAVTSADITLA